MTRSNHLPRRSLYDEQERFHSKVYYENNLVKPYLQQYLPVDQTLHWADPRRAHREGKPMPMCQYSGPVPAVVHLHGGEVPSAYDGGPDSWFTPDTQYTGPGFITDTYVYPNEQQATTLWFHDHTLGATRLNVYAGLAGFYLLRDDRDTGEINNPIGLPGGPYEAEIVIQDRMFDTNGQLFFPHDGVNPSIHPFWVPEFFGDVIVVNGKAWPYMKVEPRRYRFRLLNGSNARFYRLRLGNLLPSGKFWQIGTDGGLLDAPVQITDYLLMAPGERCDVIVDFTGMQGQILTMTNDAPTPFPGAALPDSATTAQIMQFQVVLPLSRKGDRSLDPKKLNLRDRNRIVRLTKPKKAPLRQLTLNEHQGAGGPLEVLVNNSKWAAVVTEAPQVGSTEQWEIINLTMDAHPIHLHLVQFQLLNRQAFNETYQTEVYNKAFKSGDYTPAAGPPLPYDVPNADGALGGNPPVSACLVAPIQDPLPNEKGWKDTVVAYPGEVTRILVRFAPQELKLSEVGPGDNEYSFNPSKGPGYVWHCHIVDHEDNEMMRPMIIDCD